jgi:hypothetical protein
MVGHDLWQSDCNWLIDVHVKKNYGDPLLGLLKFNILVCTSHNVMDLVLSLTLVFES